ncbi:zinc-binding protein A33-like [Protopterus annectens]|uniref:zinc-binding protein A33-like n=1 Tax=Protopterus annectens TaxID=7888 RepID=UPI001CFAF057|nr:zinc-binding protein A33-like [Protopterus annectens]
MFILNESKSLKQSFLRMACSKQTGDYMEEFICSVCLEVLNVPVMLECGHNFCRACIDRVWYSEKQPACPECRQECSTRKYTVNRLLASLIQRVLTQGPDSRQKAVTPESVPEALFSEHSHKTGGPDSQLKDHNQLCIEHEESLKLFCEDDESLVCLLCVPEHRGHKFMTVQKAISMYKDVLTMSLGHLQSGLKHFKDIKYQQEIKILKVKDNAQSLQWHIISEFAKLHRFLQEKEKKIFQQLKEEEMGILRQMEENLKKIKNRINSIEESIPHIQLQLQQQDAVTFLKEIKSFPERFTKEQKKGDGEIVVAHSLNLGPYKGPLQYGVWKEMKSILNLDFVKLSLDPNTAHNNLILSENLTSVTYGDVNQNLPDKPERFNPYVFVMGSEGFISGRHYWEVEVGNKTEWYVAVARESVNRKGQVGVSPENGYWTICLRKENVYKALDTPVKILSLSVKPQRIGVYLDYEGGQVSFYNAENMFHIYTFTDNFKDRLFPLFSPCHNNRGNNAEPLKLIHLKL